MAMSSKDPPIQRPMAWAILLVLTAINFLNYLDRYVLSAVLEPIRLEFDLADRRLGFLCETVTVSDPRAPLTLRFAPWIALEGWVADPMGDPVRGALVRAQTERGERLEVARQSSRRRPFVRHSAKRRYRKTETGADGRFQLPLWPGTYTIEALIDGHVRVRAQGVELSAGADTEALVMTLEDLITYRVRTVDAAGAPIAGIRVFLKGPGGSGLVTHGDSSTEGLIELQALPRTYPLRKIYSRDRYRPVPPLPTLSPETPEVTLVLEPEDDGLVEIPGVVLHEDAPVPGAWVRFVRHKGGQFGGHLLPQDYITADENGRFTVRNEPGATMWITAHGPGFAVARSELVTVPAEGPAPEVVVSSLPGDDLTVRVVDSDGRPVERVLLLLWRDGTRWEEAGRPPCGGWGRTGGDGNWVFARLPAGEYTLDARCIDERLHAPRKTFSWPAEASSIVLTVECGAS